MGAAVAVAGLRKAYGRFEALRGVDLEIAPGEVFALLGPNGAGKTTFIEILEGYRARSAGTVSVLGVDPAAADARWRARVGVVLQSTAVFDALSVEEVVREFAGFYPAPLAPALVIDLVGLGEERRQRCGSLSGGQRRRVDLALGLVGDPALIFLDEPTTGLDPQGRRQLWDVVRQFTALGKTVLLTTHYLEEAEALAHRVGVIIRGRLAALGRPQEIGGRDRALARVAFEATGPLAAASPPSLAAETTRAGGRVTVVTARPTETVAQLAAWAGTLGVTELPGLTVSRPSLEDVYLELVASANEQAGLERQA